MKREIHQNKEKYKQLLKFVSGDETQTDESEGDAEYEIEARVRDVTHSTPNAKDEYKIVITILPTYDIQGIHKPRPI